MKAVESILGVHSGIDERIADEITIDAAALLPFINASLRRLSDSNSRAFFTLLSGPLKILIALYERVTESVPDVPSGSSDAVRQLVAEARHTLDPV